VAVASRGANEMANRFDPEELAAIAREASKAPAGRALAAVHEGLLGRYPGLVESEIRWVFNNAGGAMGQMALLHASLREYLLLFGTPIGTEGHSGRYRTEVWDFMLEGEMWCYHEGETSRSVYRPGDAAYLGKNRVKGYRIPDHGWMLEYARGPIPTMLPFGLADTVFSTVDYRGLFQSVSRYARLTITTLLRR
jgi:hypothetical protein